MYSFSTLPFIWILLYIFNETNICPFKASCNHLHALNPNDYQLRSTFPHAIIFYVGESQVIPLIFEKKVPKGFEESYKVILFCTPAELVNCDFNGLYQNPNFIHPLETRINISLNFIKKQSYENITKSWSFLAFVEVKPKISEKYLRENYKLLERLRKTVFDLFKKENYYGIVIILYIICVLFPIITLVGIFILYRKTCFKMCVKLRCKERRAFENIKDNLSLNTSSPFAENINSSTFKMEKFDPNSGCINYDNEYRPYLNSSIICEVSNEKSLENNVKHCKYKETLYGDYNLRNNLPDILQSHDAVAKFNKSVFNNSIPSLPIENNKTRSSIESGEINFYSEEDNNKDLHFLPNSLSNNMQVSSQNVSSKDNSHAPHDGESLRDVTLIKKELNLLTRQIDNIKRKINGAKNSQNDYESQSFIAKEIHKKYSNTENYTMKKNPKRNNLHQNNAEIFNIEKSNTEDKIKVPNFKISKNFNVHNQPFNTDFQNFLIRSDANFTVESIEKKDHDFINFDNLMIYNKGDCNQTNSLCKPETSSEKQELFQIDDYQQSKDSIKEELQKPTVLALKNSRTIHKTIDKNNKIIRYYESLRGKYSEACSKKAQRNPSVPKRSRPINRMNSTHKELLKVVADFDNNSFKKPKSPNLENNYSLKIFKDDSDSDTLNNIYCHELEFSNRSDCNRKNQLVISRNPSNSLSLKTFENFNDKIVYVTKNGTGPVKIPMKLKRISSENSDGGNKNKVKISTDFDCKSNKKFEMNIRIFKNSRKTIFGNYGQKFI